MSRKEGEPMGASYNRVTTNGNTAEATKRTTFEPPADLHSKLMEDDTFKDRDMDIDPAKETNPSSTKAP